MKKILLFLVVPILAASFVTANAQTTSVSGSGTATGGIYTSPEPIAPPTSGNGFVQFNSLVAQSVSAQTTPAEVIATFQGGALPSITEGGLGASAGVGIGQCLHFNSQNDSNAQAIRCPTPPTPVKGPSPVSNSYRIEVSASTELMLRDRTPATLTNIAQGDQLNVFGFYNTDGSIQAYLIRDLSKPVQTQTYQLNNVVLTSISGTSLPATLTFTQTYGSPCYGFVSNNESHVMPCPMGAAAANPASTTASGTANIMMRAYSVTVDANTIVLDKNRTQLGLGGLTMGDHFNVYGTTGDNGQTITADIIRDLSVPVSASSFAGSITQVNADGSFVIKTNDGQTYTVQNPVSVGESVTLQGMLNSSQNSISQVTRLMVGNSTPPMPTAAPMMRINGSNSGEAPRPSTGPINY